MRRKKFPRQDAEQRKMTIEEKERKKRKMKAKI